MGCRHEDIAEGWGYIMSAINRNLLYHYLFIYLFIIAFQINFALHIFIECFKHVCVCGLDRDCSSTIFGGDALDDRWSLNYTCWRIIWIISLWILITWNYSNVCNCTQFSLIHTLNGTVCVCVCVNRLGYLKKEKAKPFSKIETIWNQMIIWWWSISRECRKLRVSCCCEWRSALSEYIRYP